MFTKTEKFIKFLDENKFDFFDVRSTEDLDVLSHVENSNGASIQELIFFNDDDCVQVVYHIAQCSSAVKREQLYELLNGLNADRKIKYYMRKDGAIIAVLNYWTDDRNFDSATLFALSTSVLFSIMEDDYNKIMKVVWG